MEDLFMDSNSEVAFEYPNVIRVYKNGRFERFVDATCGFVPPSTCDSTPAGVVASKDIPIPDGVSARLYLPSKVENINKLPVLVYFHGGGFFTGSAFCPVYNDCLSAIVSKSNVVAVSVEYRLAPEHPIPAAYDDCYAALKWVVSQSSDEWINTYGDMKKIIVAGDSAGANIAHNVVMRAGADGLKVDGMVLLCPYFWGSIRLGKEEERRSYLRLEWLDEQWPYFCPTAKHNGGNDDPRVNPTEGALSLDKLGCGRAMVIVAEHDALYARGKAYAAALQKNLWNGKVELVEYDGEDHCFYLHERESDKAMDVMEKLAKFLNE